MKYLYSLTLMIVISVSGIQTTFAAAVATGAATLVQQIVQEGTSQITKGSTLTNTASTLTNTAANVKQMILDGVLKPLGGSLIQLATQQVSSNLITWAAGGFQGDPVLISDPASYIKRSGLSQVKIALGQIPADSVFGDSIFNSLVSQYKGSDDLASKIQSLSKSDLPGMIKNTVCNDAKLTSLAMEAVKLPDGTYNAADLAAKKTEIYNYACLGNPDTDPVVAARLQDFADQRPGLIGLNGVLSITAGSNEYTKGVQAINAVEQKKLAAQDLAKNEIYNGAGPVSERKCIKYAPSYAIGQTPECEQWQTTNPGKLIQKTIGDALSAPLTRLTNLTANGITDAALSSFLSSFAQAAITGGIQRALNTAQGGTNNTPIVLTKKTLPVQDLANDPLKKQQYSNITNTQLSTYKSNLDKIYAVDVKYSSAISSYEGKILAGQTCYQNLAKDNIISNSDPAFGFYTSRLSLITPTKNRINAEIVTIGEAYKLINETNTKIVATNSSEEIGTITTEFLDARETRGYPKDYDYAEREGEYQKDLSDVNGDTQIDTYNSNCATIRATYSPPQQIQNQQNINTGGCFIAGTQISMADGTTKNIETVKGNDFVITSSGLHRVVKPLIINYKGNVYAFNGDGNYFVTPNHPFMTTDGWKSLDPAATRKEIPGIVVSKLSIGDTLIMKDNKTKILRTLESKYIETAVYNFKVEGDHTYYANDYLVHNKDL
jgi:hypothetical protein